MSIVNNILGGKAELVNVIIIVNVIAEAYKENSRFWGF